ncbi:MAG: tripartite tricarboxylate transporter TctB family protein [Candidatus Accumulibacter sp.]|nr:tripartite tricarboxylate transporter TctB family protein [Accumulibacter sp.]
MKNTRNTHLADFVMGLLFILLALYWLVEAERMLKVDTGLGPGDYPGFVAWGFLLFGGLLVASSLRRGFPAMEGKVDWKAARRLIVFVAATLVYVQAMKPLGFVLTTPFYLFFGICFFGYKKYVTAAVCSVGMTAAMYVVFRMIFQVMLPELRAF